MSERSITQWSNPGILAIQQRVLPTYRIPFFEKLGSVLAGRLEVIAGQPCAGEAITCLDTEQSTNKVHNFSLFFTSNRYFRNPSSSLFLCWQAGLLKRLERIQPAALIVEANPRLRSTTAAIRWMHARARPVIGWGLGAPASNGLLSGWRRNSWPQYLRQFDALIAYSSSGAEQYQQLGIPKEKIFVALNAATPRPAAPPPARSTSLDRPITVLFVGRIQERKRIDLLLNAASALPPTTQPRLIVVGDGPARAELQNLAQRVYPSTEFLGELTGSSLEPYYANADLFVLPGTGGLAVQQAMAHGLPVIAAQGDGTLDAIIRPNNGWRIPTGDLPALIEILQTALSDLPRLRRMGDESYRIVAEEVNIEAMVNSFIETLRIVCGFPRDFG